MVQATCIQLEEATKAHQADMCTAHETIKALKEHMEQLAEFKCEAQLQAADASAKQLEAMQRRWVDCLSNRLDEYSIERLVGWLVYGWLVG